MDESKSDQISTADVGCTRSTAASSNDRATCTIHNTICMTRCMQRMLCKTCRCIAKCNDRVIAQVSIDSTNMLSRCKRLASLSLHPCKLFYRNKGSSYKKTQNEWKNKPYLQTLTCTRARLYRMSTSAGSHATACWRASRASS